MNNIDYQKIFQEIAAELKNVDDLGKVASYIPELANVDPAKLGIHLVTVDNNHYSYGDSNEKFSIQSISKVLSLTLALQIVGDELWERVGVEPSGSAFNSLVQLEYEKGFPRNPFINAGAIVICDILVSCLDDPKRELLEFIRGITGDSGIGYSARIAESEMQKGYRNISLANLMKDFGNIHNNIETVLDLYFNLCSIEMTCKELAQTFLFLAANGVSPVVNKTIVTPRLARRVNSIMQMCGFYDEAGEFAFSTGLPGKSGVGGGIVAVHPGKFSVAVWSPKLNEKGNSYKGMKVLEALTTKTQSSIF
ncbi:MAG TPA: glutaminase [Gammaproteobacteria bacterium]